LHHHFFQPPQGPLFQTVNLLGRDLMSLAMSRAGNGSLAENYDLQVELPQPIGCRDRQRPAVSRVLQADGNVSSAPFAVVVKRNTTMWESASIVVQQSWA